MRNIPHFSRMFYKSLFHLIREYSNPEISPSVMGSLSDGSDDIGLNQSGFCERDETPEGGIPVLKADDQKAGEINFIHPND